MLHGSDESIKALDFGSLRLQLVCGHTLLLGRIAYNNSNDDLRAALGQGREVDDNDVFRFNAEFTAQLFRIKINAIQLKETVEENKKTNDQVLQDRQYQVRKFWQLQPTPSGILGANS